MEFAKNQVLNKASHIRRLVKDHHKWRSQCLNLIASENVQSPLVREFMACDLQHRYTNYDREDPTKRKYGGSKFAKQIDLCTIQVAKSLFKAKFVELRAISGQIADATIVNAFAGRGPVFEVSALNGGHAAALRYSRSSVIRLDVKELPFNTHDYNIDIDAARNRIRRVKPKLIILGAQNFLFPHPVSEIVEAAEEVGAVVAYDASHVFGLIAGGQFQDPFTEGAHVMMGSTHKTLAGPQGGLILARSNGDLASSIKCALHPALITSHHPHRIPSLAVSLLETKCFGRDYAKQIVKNSIRLGAQLYDNGVEALFEEQNFSKSHTLLAKVSDGEKAQARLEQTNIIVSHTHLPGDRKRPTGIRLGVQEITRLGMKEDDMDEIAALISESLASRKSMNKMRSHVSTFAMKFRTLHYCFDSGAFAYKYYPLSTLWN